MVSVSGEECKKNCFSFIKLSYEPTKIRDMVFIMDHVQIALDSCMSCKVYEDGTPCNCPALEVLSKINIKAQG